MGVFSSIGTTFESSISSFTATTASGVIGLITPVVLTAVTLYFTITGYMIMAGRISEPLGDVMIKGAKIALIAMVGLSTGNFMTYVVGAAHGLEGDFLSAMGSPSGNIYQLMDDSWEKGYMAVSTAFTEAGDLNFLTEASKMLVLLLAGLLGLAGLVALCAVGAGIIMLAKMALVVVLGFGPLFVCALMFPATVQWFSGWLSSVLNYIFTSVIVGAFLIIFINIFVTQVDFLSTDFANTDAEGFASTVLLDCVQLFLIAVISAYSMMQVPPVAAALAGGVSIGAQSLTSMVKGAVNNTKSVSGAAASTVTGAAGTAGRMTFGAANIATRGGAGRMAGRASSAASTRLQNISNRYMKRDNSINS